MRVAIAFHAQDSPGDFHQETKCRINAPSTPKCGVVIDVIVLNVRPG